MMGNVGVIYYFEENQPPEGNTRHDDEENRADNVDDVE